MRALDKLNNIPVNARPISIAADELASERW